MTPKEKAKELFNNFDRTTTYLLSRKCIKQFALIAVDEIIEQWERVNAYYSDFGGELNPNLIFWYEVKKEIEAL